MIPRRHSVAVRSYVLVWLLAGLAVACRAEIPRCPDGSKLGTQVQKVAFDGGLTPETLLIYRAPSLPEISIEAHFAADGVLECASPLSGWSIYWDAAVETLMREAATINAPAGSSWIFLFEDPGRATMRRAYDSVRSSKTCTDSERFEALLSKGVGNIQRNQFKEAKVCFDMAMKIDPKSTAANYGAARAVALQGDQLGRIALYEKLAGLAPQFYEARIELAYAYQSAGRSEEAERTLNQIISVAPLPIRSRCYEALTFIFDKAKRRVDAAKAKQSYVSLERQLRSRYRPLVGEAVLAFATKDLALREEEVGDYRAAANDFTAAVGLATTD